MAAEIKTSRRPAAKLTVVVPTRNRLRYCAAQFRFLRTCGFEHPIMIADSSDPPAAEQLREACLGVAEYRGFDRAIGFWEKLRAAVRAIHTPFLVVMPDDDVTFPHGMTAALAHLESNPDYVAAHGYVLRFGIHDDAFDIHNVYGFTPTIDQVEPMQRLYHLIRRYQPFVWAVFRTERFAEALHMTDGISGLIFQELTFHATAVLRGKVARLPVIFAMRGMEDTLSPLNRINPLFWCLEDADGFFRHYIAYRNKLVRRIRGETLATKSDRYRFGLWRRALRRSLAAMSRRSHDGIPALQRAVPDHGELQQTIDLIHTIWLQHEFDRGILNHAVRQRLGDALPPIDPPREWPGWRELAEGDAVHSSALAARRYIWRKDVLSAEPRDEIKIDTNEIAQVERELEAYRLD